MIQLRKWGGVGLLGATVRYDEIYEIGFVIRILVKYDCKFLNLPVVKYDCKFLNLPLPKYDCKFQSIFEGSPAAVAGLVPFTDYLLGSSERLFRNLDDLVELIEQNIGGEFSANDTLVSSVV